MWLITYVCIGGFSILFAGGVDFGEVNTNVTVPRGSLTITPDTRNCFVFAIIGDDQREPNETFTISFVPANSLDQFDGSSDVIVVIIDDNDGKMHCMIVSIIISVMKKGTCTEHVKSLHLLSRFKEKLLIEAILLA